MSVGKKYVTKDDLEAFARKLLRRIVGMNISGGGDPSSPGSGSGTFLELSDTPSSYDGEALRAVRANAGETALEFFDLDLGSISDVDLITDPPWDGDFLTYDAVAGKWVPAPCVSGGSGSTALNIGDLLDVDCGSPYVPEDGDVLTYDAVSGDWHPGAAPSGSDPWTVKKLTSDFSTSSNVPADVPGLNFTPAANKTYIIEGWFLLRTSAAATGPRVGCVFPSGLSDGISVYGVGSSTGGSSLYHLGDVSAEWYHGLNLLPDATYSWPAWINVTLVVGASPSGDFQIRLRSETNTVQVTMKAGSHIRYREI